MESRMEESILNHSIAISRIEDCEDDMQVCKGDIDAVKIKQVSMAWDIRMLEGAMGGTQEDLEVLGRRVGNFVASHRRMSSLCETNSRSLGAEVQRVQQETRGHIEGFFQKFEKVNNIIDKKIVRQDNTGGKGTWILVGTC
jgi:hypothetical protein